MEIYYGREKVLMQAGMHRYNHFGDWKYSCNDAELSYLDIVLGAVQGCPFSRKKLLKKGSRYQIKLSLISFCRNYISD